MFALPLLAVPNLFVRNPIAGAELLRSIHFQISFARNIFAGMISSEWHLLTTRHRVVPIGRGYIVNEARMRPS